MIQDKFKRRFIDKNKSFFETRYSKNRSKLNFDNMTLVCIDCLNIERAIKSLEICKYYCNFRSVKFFTSIDTAYEHIRIGKISSFYSYSEFIYYSLVDHIDTDYVLIRQHDGWICNPLAWKDEWLNYDYVGGDGDAYWSEWGGNGGFSIRSKKLLKWLKTNASKFKYIYHEYGLEDMFISLIIRLELLKDNIIISSSWTSTTCRTSNF